MDKKLTDNEIKKALECCADSTIMSCAEKGCPFRKFCQEDTNALEKASLDLLNRKDAEIERLSIENYRLKNTPLNDFIDPAKSEAIKEFAERLKTYKMQPFNYDRYLVPLVAIDEVVKEMTGQNDLKE